MKLLFTVTAFITLFSFPLLAAGPKPDAIVALDGSGDYTSLQEAISSAPMNTDPASPRWVILVKPGTYKERIHVQRERGNIHVLGEYAATTIVAFDLHANLPGPDNKPIGTFRTPTVHIDGDGMLWENITISNTAGPVGQALALRADGDQLKFIRCRFLGWQDTILVNRGRHHFVDCYIEGHVDFIFGGATAYFERCHIHCLRDGYITAASTPKDTPHGFVFADCKITGADNVKTYLGRPWREFAKTVFLRTEMSAVVRPEGWHNWNKPHAEQTSYYAEYASTGPGASPSTRVPWAKTLTAEDAADLTPEKVLSSAGFQPAASSSAAASQPATRIVLVGDSTVTDRSGWGLGFKRFLPPAIECLNTALGGRSSKSFRDEGHWSRALEARGDYYLIQFGHNDQPGKGPERETDPNTTYAENLARYVDEVRAIGAQPILVTSLCRREFDPARPGKIGGTLQPYVEAARRVADEKKVPLIDLYARSVELCERLGPEACERFNATTPKGPDRTHLDADGSVVFAKLVVEELRRAVPALASSVHP
jgi:pectinesterase